MKTNASLIVSPSDWELPKVLENPKTNEELFLKTSRSSRIKTLQSWEREDYHLVEDGQKVLLLDVKNLRVRYFVQYELGSFRGVKTVTQIALWANEDTPLPSVGGESTIKWTFFRYLLPKTGTMAADSTQTRDGMVFWKRRISEAMDRGLRTLVVIRDQGKVIEVASMQDLDRMSDIVWGRNSHHEYRRAFITQKPIFPDAIPSSEYLKSLRP